MRRKLAAGNWKMNGMLADLDQLDRIMAACPAPAADLLICLPATLIHPAAQRAGQRGLMIGAQDCHMAGSGAHTGDLAAAQLADAGAGAVILGHSERRADHHEDSATVRAKAEAAQAAGLIGVICLGETLAERDAGQTLDVIGAQLDASVPDGARGDATVIAYEPVWAIGTGRIATTDQIAQVHAFLRARLIKRFGPATGGAIRLLYGGSVKADNAAQIFAVPEVDGALVGGASLSADDFCPIVAALDASATS
ncbi:MAG: triose-phosphate isomerase [Rhodobacterales bacterium]|nr:triose-phosphate isomerase [Rhodobacterales bacterium]MDX5389599.1 triose-phosphate isomerase [Rhodobacterales bacterium]MDX5489296.1 triose-phosphate isomerase [Rhodobacterales bacterium]